MSSQLTGWGIDIFTEKEESERRQADFAERSKHFMDTLGLDETTAQLLVAEGFGSVEDHELPHDIQNCYYVCRP